jgi:hypothetical protein
MKSAGSIRDLVEKSDSEDNIYVEPDLGSPVLLIPTQTNDHGSTKHSKSKPATLPKPVALQALSATTAEVSKGRSYSDNDDESQAKSKVRSHSAMNGSDEQLERSDSQHEDDYVSPAVFKEDLEKQRIEVSTLQSLCGA